MNRIVTVGAVMLVALVASVDLVWVRPLNSKCRTISLMNGQSKLQHGGRIIRFRCLKGYQFVGRRYMNCFLGKWDYQRDPSVSLPMCVKPGCMAVAHVNGYFLESYKGAVVTVVCNLGYVLVGSPTVYCNGRTWNQPFPRCRAPSAAPKKSCDFEDDLCGWVQDVHGDWLWQKSLSVTRAGPPYGQVNPGQYILLGNSSSRIMNATEKLFSPVFPPEYSTDACFSFWFLLTGRTSGYLKAFVLQEDGEFAHLIPPFWETGEHGASWLPGFFPLPPLNVSFQVVLEGMSHPGNESVTAFDDVRILSGKDCDDAREVYLKAQPSTFGPEETSTTEEEFGETTEVTTTEVSTTTSPTEGTTTDAPTASPSRSKAESTTTTTTRTTTPAKVAQETSPVAASGRPPPEVASPGPGSPGAGHSPGAPPPRRPSGSPPAAGEPPPQSMKSDGEESARVPTAAIFWAVGAAALGCCVAVAVLVRRRRRRRLQEESMVEDSDVRFLTSDEFLDFTLARPADDDL